METLKAQRQFAQKMLVLKSMIDKRTQERIKQWQEDEKYCTLSKKTSFSSFYNLKEEDKQKNKKGKKPPRPNRSPKKRDPVSGLLCQRPKSSFGRPSKL